MKFITYVLLYIFSIILLGCKKSKENQDYIFQNVMIDKHFGEEISDPFRFIEKTSDTAVINLFKKKTDYTNKILNRISEKDETFLSNKNLEPKKNIAISKLKITLNDLYFYLKTDSLDGIKKLYFRKKVKGQERLIYNPKKNQALKETEYSINYYAPNWEGNKVVISLSKNDKEISDLIVYDIQKKKIISDTLKNSWASALGGIRWLPDDSGFTYEYIPVINKNSDNFLLNVETILYTLSDKKNAERVLFSKKLNPEIGMKSEDFPEVNFKSKQNKYMFANVSGSSYYADYYYAPFNKIKTNKIKWTPLYKRKNLVKTFALSGDDIYFITAMNAPNFKICKTSLNNLKIDKPEIIVDEDKNAVISDMALTENGLFFVKTTNGVVSRLYRFKDNISEEIKLPKIFGYINISSKGFNYPDLWLNTEGWTSKKERYRLDTKDGSIKLENIYPTGTNDNLNDVIIKEIEISSHDGTRVPLSIIHKKGIKKNGNNRLLINAYGAYKWVNRPYLYNYLEEWVKNDGIYAVAHVRGGGEKGEPWYTGGYKTTKPNSWKDLIACTEYFIEEGYSEKEKIATWGASAGGITIGRAITERPDLYKCAVIKVGLLNMLRSEFGINGKNITKEFGSVKDSTEFKALYEMDAYHHIKKGIKYPSVYLTSGMNDSRVAPWQAAKFALKLEANNPKNLVLLDVDFEGGHGFEASSNKKDKELSKIMSFLLWQTGHPDYQLKE